MSKDLEKITTSLFYGEGRAKPPSDDERWIAVEQILLSLDDYFIPEWIPDEQERAELRKLPRMEVERERARHTLAMKRDAEAFLFDPSTNVDRPHSIAWYCLRLNIKQILFQKALANKTLAAKLETFLKMPRRTKEHHATQVFAILREIMEMVKNVQPEKNPGSGPEQRSDRLVPDGTSRG